MSERSMWRESADLPQRLRSFLVPHVHISAAHKDALAEAAAFIEVVLLQHQATEAIVALPPPLPTGSEEKDVG